MQWRELILLWVGSVLIESSAFQGIDNRLAERFSSGPQFFFSTAAEEIIMNELKKKKKTREFYVVCSEVELAAETWARTRGQI